jgi:hypothetical protein
MAARRNRPRTTRGYDAPAAARQLSEQLDQMARTRSGDLEIFQETIAELQLAAEDAGWRRLTAESIHEFSRTGLTQIIAICRVMALKNPLTKRGLAARQAYIWGQGVQIAARATGARDSGEQDVNQVIQDFLDDPANKRAFTGHQARLAMEQALGTDGNLPVALFTLPTTGRVQARVIPVDEITEIIPNPEDRSEPQYYRRQWLEVALDPATGGTRTMPRRTIHPAVGFRPASRPAQLGGTPVLWDAPMLMVKVGGQLNWSFGVPDAYASVDWARAYTWFLEDWARLCRALSRFAWRLTSPGRQSTAVRAAVAAAPTRDPITGEPRMPGATAAMAPNVTLEAIPKTGATLDSESGRPMAAMVAAGLDLPVTMLLGDPGVTGARATAETLNYPTKLAMDTRRQLWTDQHQLIFEHVIRESVRAPKGLLKGLINLDDYGRERVTLAGDTDQTVDIVWPPLDQVDPGVLVASIVAANTTGTVPPEQVAKLLLQALGVNDVDEVMEQLIDPDTGDFVWPDSVGHAGTNAGQAAVDAFRAGLDPAALLNGEQQGGPGSPPPPAAAPAAAPPPVEDKEPNARGEVPGQQKPTADTAGPAKKTAAKAVPPRRPAPARG